MAIRGHLEPANHSSYTGSLPCLSYSRSMITSIIATNETLCYLLRRFAAQKVTIEDTRYCPAALHIMHSALYGKSRRHTFAEGVQIIALSDRTLGGPTGERK